MAASLAAAMAAGPGAGAAVAQMSAGVKASVASESPASRAIEIREGGLPLDLGDRGDLVAHVQKRLGVAADGIFGAQTDAAVRKYQLEAKLTVDGIVGPLTWGAMFPQANSAGVGGANVPQEVKEHVERALAGASAGLGAGGQAGAGGQSLGDGQTSVGGQGTLGGSEGGSTGTAPETAPTPQPVANGGSCSSTLTSPVSGTETSGFGPRGGRNHDGVDIAAPTGTAIHAAACGTVSLAGQQSGYGNMVCISHTSSFSTCYAHMSRFVVSSGQQVTQGQVIGYVGCTGSCTGPHLHFETRVNGQAQDPSTYLSGATVPGATTRTASASTGTSSTSTTTTSTAPSGTTATTVASYEAASTSPATADGALEQSAGTTVAAEAPATSGSATEIEATVAAEPLAAEPVVETTVAAEPVAAPAPVPAEPVAAEPVVETTVAAEPVVETTAAAEPVAAPAPVPAEPVAAEPAVAVPAIAAAAEQAAPEAAVAVQSDATASIGQ